MCARAAAVAFPHRLRQGATQPAQGNHALLERDCASTAPPTTAKPAKSRIDTLVYSMTPRNAGVALP